MQCVAVGSFECNLQTDISGVISVVCGKNDRPDKPETSFEEINPADTGGSQSRLSLKMRLSDIKNMVCLKLNVCHFFCCVFQWGEMRKVAWVAREQTSQKAIGWRN